MSKGNPAFIIKIISRDNATWQGTITWTQTSETQHFRSALELMKIIDSACSTMTPPT